MSNEAPIAPTVRVAPLPVRGPLSNGIRMPAEGSIARFVWDTASFISSQARRPATKKEVMSACTQQGAVMSTTMSAFIAWRKFYGLPSTPHKKTTLKSPVVDAAALKEALENNGCDPAAAVVQPAQPPVNAYATQYADTLAAPALEIENPDAPAAVGDMSVLNQNAWYIK